MFGDTRLRSAGIRVGFLLDARWPRESVPPAETDAVGVPLPTRFAWPTFFPFPGSSISHRRPTCCRRSRWPRRTPTHPPSGRRDAVLIDVASALGAVVCRQPARRRARRSESAAVPALTAVRALGVTGAAASDSELSEPPVLSPALPGRSAAAPRRLARRRRSPCGPLAAPGRSAGVARSRCVVRSRERVGVRHPPPACRSAAIGTTASDARATNTGIHRASPDPEPATDCNGGQYPHAAPWLCDGSPPPCRLDGSLLQPGSSSIPLLPTTPAFRATFAVLIDLLPAAQICRSSTGDGQARGSAGSVEPRQVRWK